MATASSKAERLGAPAGSFAACAAVGPLDMGYFVIVTTTSCDVLACVPGFGSTFVTVRFSGSATKGLSGGRVGGEPKVGEAEALQGRLGSGPFCPFKSGISIPNSEQGRSSLGTTRVEAQELAGVWLAPKSRVDGPGHLWTPGRPSRRSRGNGRCDTWIMDKGAGTGRHAALRP